ncbi:MAG: hypothetical protein RBR16_00605 [Syntrophus sp. (in: bacteria)]|nr:hypothetical protein [Syntrophus sp. (in: bacteria)]
MEPPPVQQEKPITVKRRCVDVVGHGEHRQVFPAVQAFQQIKNSSRVLHVQMSCGFIEEKDLRFLGKRTGDMRPLFFSAAEVVHAP